MKIRWRWCFSSIQVLLATGLLYLGHQQSLASPDFLEGVRIPHLQPATAICYSLNAPALIAVYPFSQILVHCGLTVRDNLLFLVAVFLFWYGVGKWVESRVRKEPRPTVRPALRAGTDALLVLAAALLTLNVWEDWSHAGVARHVGMATGFNFVWAALMLSMAIRDLWRLGHQG